MKSPTTTPPFTAVISRARLAYIAWERRHDRKWHSRPCFVTLDDTTPRSISEYIAGTEAAERATGRRVIVCRDA